MRRGHRGPLGSHASQTASWPVLLHRPTPGSTSPSHLATETTAGEQQAPALPANSPGGQDRGGAGGRQQTDRQTAGALRPRQDRGR